MAGVGQLAADLPAGLSRRGDFVGEDDHMAKLGYSVKLFREFVGFARENRAYWIVPLVLLFALAAFIVVVGEGGAPLIYTLF
jgi:hypothetical protein